MLLVVDNGSIYTKNLIEFLSKNNKNFSAIPFDKVNLETLSDYDSVILSGRRSNDQKMNLTNSKIVNFAIINDVPLLGICYGAEILALTIGGTIRKMESLQKGTNTITVISDNPLCSDKMDVFESHRYEISKIPNTISLVATSNDCKNEIIRLNKSNIFGTQFHPEMSKHGQKLIENFTNLE